MKKDKKKLKKRQESGKKMLQETGLAMKHEFYLEASWILSSILEKKLKKMLEKIENVSPGAGYSFEQSIKRIKHLHLVKKHPLFSDHFEVGLIDEIRNWKNQRNTILKDMLEVHVSKARLERLALEGTRLLKEWNMAQRKFKARSAPSAS